MTCRTRNKKITLYTLLRAFCWAKLLASARCKHPAFGCICVASDNTSVAFSSLPSCTNVWPWIETNNHFLNTGEAGGRMGRLNMQKWLTYIAADGLHPTWLQLQGLFKHFHGFLGPACVEVEGTQEVEGGDIWLDWERSAYDREVCVECRFRLIGRCGWEGCVVRWEWCWCVRAEGCWCNYSRVLCRNSLNQNAHSIADK